MHKYILIFIVSLVLLGCSQEVSLQNTGNTLLSSGETIDLVPEPGFRSSELRTDMSRSNILLTDILDGGPGKDGIPAIDVPVFLSVGEASGAIFLTDDILGVMVKRDSISRFYPYSILVWHEIVNDTLEGDPIAVTYCPLCGTAIVYDRRTLSGVLDFGVSGKLWQSNLLMYDRQTETLWSQAIGEAVVGEKLGQELEYYPSDLLTWKQYREKYPNGEVLSDRTGHSRDYSRFPYGDYDREEGLYFPVDRESDRLPQKTLIYVVRDSGVAIGFSMEKLRESTILSGSGYTARYDSGEVRVEKDGVILPGFYQMWFSFYTHNKDNFIIIQ